VTYWTGRRYGPRRSFAWSGACAAQEERISAAYITATLRFCFGRLPPAIGLALAGVLFLCSAGAEPQPAEEIPPASAEGAIPAVDQAESTPPAGAGPTESVDPAAEAAPTDGVDPAAADETVLVEKFTFAGNVSVPTAELEQLVAPHAGKEYDLPGLEKIAEEVTTAYRARGLTLATAYIQEQEIDDGVVEITIVEGRVGQVLVEGNSRYSSEFIRGHLDGLLEESFRQDELEDALLVLNANPYLKVETTLQPGTEEGATDILAKVDEGFPLHLNLHFDNFGSELVSRNQFGAELEWNHPWIDGAKLTLGANVGEDPEVQSSYRLGYSLPIGHRGTRVAWTGYTGNFTLGKELAILGVQGNSYGWGIAVTHPLIKHRDQTLDLRVGYDNKTSKSFLLEQISSHDEVRSVHLGADYMVQHWNGVTFGSIYGYQGLGDFLGGTEKGDPDRSRRTADNQFTRFSISLGRSQQIVDWFSLFCRGSSQVSCDSLLAGEQMPIGGSSSVRGYTDGEASGDSAYSMSFEGRIRPFPGAKVGFDLLGFADYGARHLRKPTVDQSRWLHLGSAGAGARLDLSGLGLPADASVRFDVAWPLDPAINSDGRKPVFYLSSDLRF